MATLSTHVLDTSVGRPAADLAVTLRTRGGEPLGDGVTDADGRVGAIGPDQLPAGDYVLTFDSGSYFAARGVAAFYPEISILFEIDDGQHYHVPVLLNPFGYTTYRGS